MNSVVLDVVIGLVLIYLLYSLLITIIGEMVGTWLGIRERILRVAIERMLNDGLSKKLEEQIPGNLIGWIREWFRSFFLFEPKEFDDSLAGRFYKQPSIKYLSIGERNNLSIFRHSKPAYFSGDVFAQTLIYLLRDKGTGATDLERINFCLQFNTLHIQLETIKHIQDLVIDSGNDINVFNQKLQGWFEETMDRANGWFKRKLQFILFWLGFILAVSFNADSIEIAKILAKDENARNQLVNMGIQMAKDSLRYHEFIEIEGEVVRSEAVIDSGFARITKDLNEANSILGLGWNNLTKYSSREIEDKALWKKTKADVEACIILNKSIGDLRKTIKYELNDSSKKISNVNLAKQADQLNEHIKAINNKTDFKFLSINNFVEGNEKSPSIIYGQAYLSSGEKFGYFFLHIIGYIITALALSLGAPFWFDLLKRLVAIRGAGVKPEAEKESTAKINRGDVDRNKQINAEIVEPFQDPSFLYDKCKKELLNIDGVISVMDKNSTSKNSIIIFTNKDIADSIIADKIKEVSGGKINIDFTKEKIIEIPTQLNIVLSSTNDTSPKYGIANKSKLLGFGALGCIVEDKFTKDKHFLSCWHVMKGDLNFNNHNSDDTLIIDFNQGKTIGQRWGGGINEELDVAIASISKNDIYENNDFLKIGKDFTLGYVFPEDADKKLAVKFFDNIKDKVVDGNIINEGCSAKIWCVDGRYRHFHNLIVIASATGQNTTPGRISNKGNSGSIVFDDNRALAMIIAGDGTFAYAIKMSKIFDRFKELQFIKSPTT